jgi:hypothetical protein
LLRRSAFAFNGHDHLSFNFVYDPVAANGCRSIVLSRPVARLTPFAPAAIILILTLAFFYKLAFTDHILARGDTFAYFYPYWQARDAALSAGHFPLWTPNLFMGVPLLANSQLGTFYPPNWWVMRLPPPDAVRVSILLHVAWGMGGAYLLARGALSLDVIPSLMAAALFALGGHVSAHVEQINQLQGLSWMPWLFLLLDRAQATPLRFTPLLGMALALQFLSGHTQTVFITGLGLAVYGLLTRPLRSMGILLAAGIIALLLALPQLIPTLEMTQVSNRRTGFNQNQATAFSFSPFVLGRGLLPSYEGAIFGEYIAYVGVIGLGLAVLGLFSPTPNPSHHIGGALPDSRGDTLAANRGRFHWISRRPPKRIVWTVIGIVGVLLAFGVYNPLYWWLASLPGFNLFRVPARWLALLALSASMLAGLGLQTLMVMPRRVVVPILAAIIVIIGGLAAGSTLATRTPELVPMSAPTSASFLAWGLALVALVGLIMAASAAGWARRIVSILVLVASLVELFAAAQTLPYNDLTTPEAFDARRFTINQLLAYGEGQPAPGRVLSISNLYFDPGDRTALEQRYAAMGLSESAVRNAFNAIKMKETLAANLPLIWDIQSVDGFDGGLLPTAYYTAFTSMLLPPDSLRTIDGRLREILAREECRGACLPDQRWLNLTNTRYLITDKIYDVWYQDVAYDTQFEADLAAGEALVIDDVPRFEADAVYVLYQCVEESCPVPSVTLADGGGGDELLGAADEDAVDEYRLVRLHAPDARTWSAVEMRSTAPMRVGAVTLVDTRTGDFVQLMIGAWRRILSSDIKLYENETVLPRAFVVHDAYRVSDHEWGTEDAISIMKNATFDPSRTVILAVPPSADLPIHQPGEADDHSNAEITAYTDERIEVHVNTSAAGHLVLTDAYYPGWTATVNGEPTQLSRADVMFRAVAVPAGESAIVFEYHPAWWPIAQIVGLAAWGLITLLAGAAMVRRRGRSSMLTD